MTKKIYLSPEKKAKLIQDSISKANLRWNSKKPICTSKIHPKIHPWRGTEYQNREVDKI